MINLLTHTVEFLKKVLIWILVHIQKSSLVFSEDSSIFRAFTAFLFTIKKLDNSRSAYVWAYADIIHIRAPPKLLKMWFADALILIQFLCNNFQEGWETKRSRFLMHYCDKSLWNRKKRLTDQPNGKTNIYSLLVYEYILNQINN